jgi:hypothetical protein
MSVSAVLVTSKGLCPRVPRLTVTSGTSEAMNRLTERDDTLTLGAICLPLTTCMGFTPYVYDNLNSF